MAGQKAAIQNEIAAAQKKLNAAKDERTRQRLIGYIQGLNQSLYVLSTQPNKDKELNY